MVSEWSKRARTWHFDTTPWEIGVSGPRSKKVPGACSCVFIYRTRCSRNVENRGQESSSKPFFLGNRAVKFRQLTGCSYAPPHFFAPKFSGKVARAATRRVLHHGSLRPEHRLSGNFWHPALRDPPSARRAWQTPMSPPRSPTRTTNRWFQIWAAPWLSRGERSTSTTCWTCAHCAITQQAAPVLTPQRRTLCKASPSRWPPCCSSRFRLRSARRSCACRLAIAHSSHSCPPLLSTPDPLLSPF